MKIGVLFSGGKDSCLAMYKAREYHEIVCLISLISKNPESYMFHVPNIELTRVQAEAIGLPLITTATSGKKEKELRDLKTALRKGMDKFSIEGVVTGAIRSTYQTSRIQRVCCELNLWCFNPLWLKDQIELLNEIVDKGFQTIISGVFAFPLDRSFLGKTITKETVRRLEALSKEYNLNPAGEGGELETTVLDAPFFEKKVEILNYEIQYQNNSGTFTIKEDRLITK